MSILTREDNKQFVLQPYRELLNYKSFNLLRKEVALLAKSNGNFVRLFKRPNNQFEAVFSRDAGYLLGESMWQHFGKVNNLIVCETLPDDKHVLLLVVRNGSVLLDLKVTKETLYDELNPLRTTKTQFDVYVYGNVPALERVKDETTDASFDEDHVRSFTQLDKPIFEQLIADPDVQLLPLEYALKEHQVKSPVTTVTAIAIFVLLFGGYLLWHNQNKGVGQQHSIADIFQHYKTALSTPAPVEQITAYAKAVITLYDIPGWVATKVDFSENQANFQVHSLGGTVERLLAWAKQHQALVDLTSQGAKITLPIRVKPRTIPKTITNDNQVTAWIIDEMMRLLPGKSVKITNVISSSGFKETELTINFNKISPEVLSLIGQTFAGLPINLGSSTATINNGLLSGSIKLTVLGS